MERKEHPSLGGPFILLAPKGKPQVVYLEVQHISRLITDQDEVRVLAVATAASGRRHSRQRSHRP